MNNNTTEKIAGSLSSGWQGKVNLIYADRQNTTQIIHNLAIAPLKVQRPFYPEGADFCHSVILHTAGGMVGGDRLTFDVQLQPNAKALITTAAASKIYRSNGLQAKQNIQIKVDSGAYLEWLPQDTIIFNGANYQQDLRVELAPKASWLGWEINRFGRSARGEKFLTGEWRSYTEIWRQGKPLWIDRQWLPAGEEIINSPHSLAGQPIVASLVWVGEKVSPEIVEKARELWQNQPDFSIRGEAGVTQITEGLLCRYRGDSSIEVRHWFKQIWHLLRVGFCDRPSCPPRVWQ